MTKKMLPPAPDCAPVPRALHPGYGYTAPRTSAHAEFFLQAGRGGGVLEHELLVGEDVMIGLLRHQRHLVEAAQDELDLARVPIDVAYRENPALARLEFFRVDRD